MDSNYAGHFTKYVRSSLLYLLWPRWQLAVVVLELASLPVEVWDAVALVGLVHHEAQRVVLARVRVAPLQLDITDVARKTLYRNLS